jgi:hypothetical protein
MILKMFGYKAYYTFQMVRDHAEEPQITDNVFKLFYVYILSIYIFSYLLIASTEVCKNGWNWKKNFI